MIQMFVVGMETVYPKTYANVKLDMRDLYVKLPPLSHASEYQQMIQMYVVEIEVVHDKIYANVSHDMSEQTVLRQSGNLWSYQLDLCYLKP